MTEHSNFLTGLACSGITTFIYSCLMTPFDVIKSSQISAVKLRTPFHTAKNLVDNGGVKILWRGLGPALVTQYSANIAYYPLYEHLRPILEKNLGFVGPGIAALMCRAFSVCLTLPVEKFRTGIQGTGAGHLNLSTHGLRATLHRDLIFSFTFFMILENVYKIIKEEYPQSGRTISCIIASTIAGVITHPFDVVKTKIQTRYCCYNEYDKNTFQAMKVLYEERGIKNLFIGFQPRMTKIVTGLVIYINVYEFLKKSFSRNSF